MNKIRNVHSPAGQAFSLQNTHLTLLTDCPRCKYGTIDPVNEKGRKVVLNSGAHTHWRCADCMWLFTVKEVRDNQQKKGQK